MKKIICIAVAAILYSPAAHARDIVLEFAGGFGSQYIPFNSKWNGSVSHDGLYHKEFAFSGSYQARDWLVLSGTIGWVRERDNEHVYFIPEFPPFGPATFHQDVTYFRPTIRFTHEVFRADLGTIIYSSAQDNGHHHAFDHPFDGSHLFKPTMGIEFGENSTYVFIRYLDSFPLYSAGLMAVGLGGRIAGLYEQQVAVIGGPYDINGIGYRGEFRVYSKTAVSVGLSLAGFGNDVIYVMSLGLKTIL